MLAALLVFRACTDEGGGDLAPDLRPEQGPADAATDGGDARGGDALDATLEAAADQLGPLPCTKTPCATRPILFIHGFRGSNDDWDGMLKGLVSADGRYDGYHWSGVLDHTTWAARSISRRFWLFALDYYIQKKDDGRESYTAGPGRIGSNTAHACAAPSGYGYLLADKSGYDQGVSHDYAADLASFVDTVLLATGATEVDVVAHSMGGLILRSYLSFYGGAAKVKRVLLLASPIKGVPLAGFLAYFPLGQPAWMGSHEVAELDGGSPLSKIRFTRCKEGPAASPGAWAVKLTDHEVKTPPAVDIHCMTGQLDLAVSYSLGHHPLALSHQVVALVDHTGLLSAGHTISRVSQLLGGTYPP